MIIGLVSIFVGFVLLTPSSVPAQEKVLKLRYSTFFPPVHPIAKLADEWCKEIEKQTNGRVTFSFFPGNTLTPPTQTYDSVVKGIADVGSSLMAYSPGRFPLDRRFRTTAGVYQRLPGHQEPERLLSKVPTQGIR